MYPLNDPEDINEATQLINQYAASDWCKFIYTQHAKERAALRVIPADVIQSVLANGQVIEVRKEAYPNGRARYAYNVQLIDRYGRVNVVTAVVGSFQLLVVTTYTDVPD
ncbi:hypothetical protein D3C75_637600 [compost metagenome]